MKPTQAAPATRSLSPALAAMVQKGMTDRGEFRTEGPTTQGYSQVTFKPPQRQFESPGFLKSLGSKNKADPLDVMTEEAVNLRDKLFAELAQISCDAKRVKKRAERIHELGAKGVDLDQINWAMGRETLEAKKGSMFEVQYDKFKNALEANLERVLRPEQDSAYTSMGEKAIGILKRFEAALDPSDSSTTTTTTTTANLAATTTSTTNTTVISGTVGTTWTSASTRVATGQRTAETSDHDLDAS